MCILRSLWSTSLVTLVVDYKKNILVSRDHVVGQEQNEVVRRIKGYVVDWELDGDGRVHLWDGHQVEEVLDLAGRLLRKQERNIVEDWIWINEMKLFQLLVSFEQNLAKVYGRLNSDCRVHVIRNSYLKLEQVVTVKVFQSKNTKEKKMKWKDKKVTLEAVVVAQLAERALPIPEVRGSNPVIGKIL